MTACLFFLQIVLNFRKEGMLNRHALRYLGRTLITIITTMNWFTTNGGIISDGILTVGQCTYVTTDAPTMLRLNVATGTPKQCIYIQRMYSTGCM